MINTYDHNIRIEGENNTSSMTDKILELANGNTIDNLNPLNTSLAFWTDLIDLQNNNKGDLNKSITILEELLFNNPNWSYLWRLLSKASGKLNKKGIAYIALAEEALIKKNFIKAKKYVDLANKQNTIPSEYKLRGSDILARIKLNK